jgi:hypothetical protein
MDNRRCAVVVAHAAHLLTVVGMLLRWRPHVLVLNRAGVGPGVEQPRLVREGLALLGLADQATEFGIVETESYPRALVHDFDYFLKIGDRIAAWLDAVEPEVVLGDAFELSNFQHDVGRFLLDRALRGRSVLNFEFPLSYQPSSGSLLFGTLPAGPFEQLRLSAAEAALKREVVERAAAADPFVANVRAYFPSLETETYREVGAARDYTRPPADVERYYDRRGREEVAAGKYENAISFDEHFVPLVRALS